MSLRLAAAATLVVALSGCPYHPRSPQPRQRQGEWAEARDAMSRRAILYDGTQHRATATATFLSLEVREARARRLSEWLGWTPRELADRLAKERAEAAAGEEFVLAFFAATSKANDLDAPKSIWRVALKVGNEDLLATRVTSVDSDANLVGLFPYVGPFDVVYRVIFPRSPSGAIQGRPFVLELASALGKLDIDYGPTIEQPPTDPWQPVPPP